MYCILHISTNREVDDYKKGLVKFLGNNYQTQTIYEMTTLAENEIFIELYFFGNTNQKVNYLIAKEGGNTMRIFVEGVNRRDNLDQLISGATQIFQTIRKFLDKNKIKYKEIFATIWSEGEEMLKGEYKGYWEKFKLFLPEIPTGIYLTFFTIIYSIFKPATKEGDIQLLEPKIGIIVLDLLVLALALLLWLLIKAYYKEPNLTFNLKS
jgi:hypothetical protein